MNPRFASTPNPKRKKLKFTTQFSKDDSPRNMPPNLKEWCPGHEDSVSNITPIKPVPNTASCSSCTKTASGRSGRTDYAVNSELSTSQSLMLVQDDSFVQAFDLEQLEKQFVESNSNSSKPVNLSPQKQVTSLDWDVCENSFETTSSRVKPANMVQTTVGSDLCGGSHHNRIPERPNESSPDHCSFHLNNLQSPDVNEQQDELCDLHVCVDEVADVHIDWGNDSMVEAAMEKCDVLHSSDGMFSNMKQALLNNAHKSVTAVKHSLESRIYDKPDLENHTENQSNSLYFDIGPYFGLPSKVKHLIEQYKGISELYEWQEECLNLPAIEKRKNLVYALPTSGGKTLVAEILILKEILCRKKNAVFILPYVSIVQEKVRSLSPFALELDFFLEEFAAGKGQYPPRKRRHNQSVYVATIEKAMGLVNSLIECQRLPELGLVVVDELHLIGENSGRGSCLENLLTKLLNAGDGLQIIGMSATIGNLEEVASFLRAETYTKDFRPVELAEYVKCGEKIWAIKWGASTLKESVVLDRRVNFDYTREQLKADPDHIGGLVKEVVPQGSVLVFCPNKKNCENVAQLVCKVLPRTIVEHKIELKKSLYRALVAECNGPVCPILERTLPYGVAYHHAGLTVDERRLIEEAYSSNTLCCICCTSTLAAGVNLPASRVIVRSPYVGQEFITLGRYKQMVGRAGRAGLGVTGESILICQDADTTRVGTLIQSGMDRVHSQLLAGEGQGLRSLVLSAVWLGLATTRSTLRTLVGCTLLAAQEGANVVPSELDNAVRDLIKQRALGVAEEDVANCQHPRNNSDSSILQDVSVRMVTSTLEAGLEPDARTSTPGNNKSNRKKQITVHNTTELTVSRLGKAATKGGMSIHTAHMLYSDLKRAQESLVLSTSLHLLFLVTPYDTMEHVKPLWEIYYSVYSQLNAKEVQAARVIGITERTMVQLRNGRLGGERMSQHIVHRFYVTLMLYELWNQKSVWEVSNRFEVPRGTVQNLMTSASSFAASVIRFCEELKEFWTFRDLLMNFSQRLAHCCIAELLPLMELPAVKRGRARQLYNAGFKTLKDIAATNATALVQALHHLSRRTANQIIAAAKLLIVEKFKNLREDAEEVLEGLESALGDP